VQLLADVQDTADSSEVEGLSVAWIVQVLPFQYSPTVVSAPLVCWSPTAMQLLAEVHETPFSWTREAPAGFGMDWSAQPAANAGTVIQAVKTAIVMITNANFPRIS